ncbi:drug resistance transporter, EmrB/QacA subfamily [Saccharopolyspora flava]|uniref:Drug resistance transporter, EmrB/QacA subfamily n=1 Tax=Saccharopolyspora flava TaxID=95161 RepID=A0A1I6V2K1_9PSEU|nr:drug resistance transporter, EmrB/QacA subfamily [Saccharopolyspora flava]
MSAPASTPPRVRRHRGLFSCLVLLTALGALDQTIVATALPTITAELGAPERASWIVTAYALAMTAVMPAVGALADRVGRRRMLGLSIAVFVGASAVCGVATSVEVLAAARFAQGLGGAGLLVLPQTVVADVVPARERAAYLGPLGAVFALATVISPLLGGWLTDAVSWRWVFWLNLPLGAAAAVLVLATIPVVRPVAASARFDTPGAVLLAAVAAGAVLISVSAAETGWGAATFAAAAVVAVLLVAALIRERRAAEPVLPLRVPHPRMVIGCYLLALLSGLGLFGLLAYVPTWAHRAHDADASTAGMLLLPATLGIVIGMNASGQLVRRIGRWRLFPALGSAPAAAAATALATTETSLLAAGLLLALVGLGTGLFMQIIVVAAQDAVPGGAVGAVTSGMTFTRELGVTVGTAILGALAAHDPTFTAVFLTTAGCFAFSLLLALALPHRTLSES